MQTMTLLWFVRSWDTVTAGVQYPAGNTEAVWFTLREFNATFTEAEREAAAGNA